MAQLWFELYEQTLQNINKEKKCFFTIYNHICVDWQHNAIVTHTSVLEHVTEIMWVLRVLVRVCVLLLLPVDIHSDLY